MDREFVRFIDIDGDVLYLRKSKINCIYVDSNKKCTAIDFGESEIFYVKGEVDWVASIWLDFQGRGVYS